MKGLYTNYETLQEEICQAKSLVLVIAFIGTSYIPCRSFVKLIFNTCLDENCVLGLGRAYPTCFLAGQCVGS